MSIILHHNMVDSNSTTNYIFNIIKVQSDGTLSTLTPLFLGHRGDKNTIKIAVDITNLLADPIKPSQILEYYKAELIFKTNLLTYRVSTRILDKQYLIFTLPETIAMSIREYRIIFTLSEIKGGNIPNEKEWFTSSALIGRVLDSPIDTFNELLPFAKVIINENGILQKPTIDFTWRKNEMLTKHNAFLGYTQDKLIKDITVNAPEFLNDITYDTYLLCQCDDTKQNLLFKMIDNHTFLDETITEQPNFWKCTIIFYNEEMNKLFISNSLTLEVKDNFLVNADTPGVQLLDIKLEGQPIKTQYYATERFNPTGLTVKAFFDNETVEIINNNNCHWVDAETGSPNLSLGTRDVLCKYKNKQAVYSGITVTEAPIQAIQIEGTPDKTTYRPGEVFDPTGLSVYGIDALNVKHLINNEDCQWLDGVTWEETLSIGTTFISCQYQNEFEAIYSPIVVSEAPIETMTYSLKFQPIRTGSQPLTTNELMNSIYEDLISIVNGVLSCEKIYPADNDIALKCGSSKAGGSFKIQLKTRYHIVGIKVYCYRYGSDTNTTFTINGEEINNIPALTNDLEPISLIYDKITNEIEMITTSKSHHRFYLRQLDLTIASK